MTMMRRATNLDPPSEAAENLVLHMTWAHARVPGMHAQVDPTLALADSGLATDTFNTVSCTRLTAGDQGRVEDAVAYFRTRGRPFSWWLGPGDEPESLPSMLRSAGLREMESEVAMAADLRALPKSASIPAGLRIVQVRTAEALRRFAEINAANWNPPDSNVLEFYDRAADVLFGPGSPFVFYVGYLDDTPVATAEITLSRRAAGLYNVSTLTKYRRRGIGHAMTLQPLLRARAAGWELGVLGASADGVGVYERAGFRAFGEYREFK